MNTAVVTALIAVLITGGHVFSTVFIPVKMYSARETGHRLYFRAVFYACFTFLSAFLLLVPDLLRRADHLSIYSLVEIYENAISNDIFLLKIFILAFLIAICLPFLLNLIILTADSLLQLLGRQPALKLFLVRSAIRGNDFEELLFRAGLTFTPLLVTLASRKFYVGWIVDGANPAMERKHVKLLPILSGSRGANFQDLQFTTNYLAVFKEISQDEGGEGIDTSDFEVVLPADEIVSAHLFDLKLYERFGKNNALGL